VASYNHHWTTSLLPTAIHVASYWGKGTVDSYYYSRHNTMLTVHFKFLLCMNLRTIDKSYYDIYIYTLLDRRLGIHKKKTSGYYHYYN